MSYPEQFAVAYDRWAADMTEDVPFYVELALEALRTRVTKVLPAQIRSCLEELSEEQIWWRPNEQSNSIGNLVLHVRGAVLHFLCRGVGGMKYERQKFNQTAAGLGASLLLLSAVGLIIPALFHLTASDRGIAVERELSLEISLVLFAIYIMSLVFSLRTHRHVYQGEHETSASGEKLWSRGRAVAVLTASTVMVAAMSELLVGALEHAAATLGLTQVFVGVILVALVGNAAEHSTAVMVAMKNKMDLALSIAVGSSLQIALLVAPVLVFCSYLFGTPLDLIFTPFEVAAVTISVLIVGFVSMDGESHWMEGVMLVGVYAMLAMAFYFLPPHG